jgi:molecular chaperone GrpE
MTESVSTPGGWPDPDAAHSPARPAAPPQEPGTGETGQPEAAGDDATIAGLQARIGDLQARIADLQARIGDLQARIADAEDLRLRALADLDNLRKRCATQVSRAEAEARARVARDWLPVLDNLERALEHSQADPAAIIAGIRAVRDQAVGVLAHLGFPRRDDTGTMFDPARHDAVAARRDPGAAAGTVIEVLRPAYGDGDHQLRPAQVVVAKAD